ncbi:phage tail protein [Salmonella enterica]|nr:phage tail protein [Salmonella enterica]EAY5893590.1 phage tail protein [Salmonella enterica]ELA1834794.1 phage tail protein [Salmonella enterica]
MSQTQLESLTAFFQQNVPPRAMQSFDSVLDEMKFIPAAKDYGLGQYRQAVIRYDAVISWQRFPYRLCPPQLLMSLLAAWLDEADRELLDEVGLTEAEPDWDVSVEDEETATIVLTVPMAEELVIREDENGAIPWQGKRWSLVNPEVWVAITANIYGVDETGAPVGGNE